MTECQNGEKLLKENMDDWNIKRLKEQGEWERKKWISAPGLCELVGKMFGANETIVGLEIGVASGWTMNHFLENLPNLKLTGIDPYVGYMDGDIEITQEKLTAQFLAALDNISDFKPRGEIFVGRSKDFTHLFEDESLDYIFIDGDHSYEGALSDCEMYFPKIKKGGIFAGHDWSLRGVNKAVNEFREKHGSPEIKHVTNDVWYWIK